MTAQQTSAATSPRVSPDVVAKPSSRFHLGYRPWLDGLRGIAIICVFIQHIQHFLYDREPIIMQFAVLGVDIFFVLSGFLITTLLLEEFQSANTISLTKFYARRGLRLLPALFVFLISMNAYSYFAAYPREAEWTARLTLGAVFYMTNWLFAFGANSDIFGHLWSLAIEEQFYLVLFILSVMKTDRSIFARVLAWPALVWVGKISYSLYLWHVFAIILTLRLPAPSATRALLSVPVAVGFAAFSYYVVERPFLRLKSGFEVARKNTSRMIR